jgi:hypothetical protein
MRAISLHQPHATFVALGIKSFETRHWPTNYRGPLLIHAAKRMMDVYDLDLLVDVMMNLDKGTGGPADVICVLNNRLPLGAFVCMVDLVDCMDAPSMPQSKFERSNGLGDFGAGRFAWELANVRRFLQPIPARGYRRFWNVNFPVAKVQPMEQITV